MSDAETLFEINGSIGLITLNRPKALNSLTREMAVAITEQLREWETNDSVQAIVIMGSGEKAFCAGGDVVKVTKSYQAGTGEWRDFFHDEYVMNVAIAEFPKPFISLVDGITMGGGVGVSMPGDFWVATEKTMFAMPETGLGLFPDVGGGWFLPRMPGDSGMFIALTGARLKSADLYALGLATHVINSSDIPELIDALKIKAIHCGNCVMDVLDSFHKDPGSAPLMQYVDIMDEHFAGFSVEDILAGLKADPSEWAQKQAKILATKSPTSLKVTFEQLRRGEAIESFRENMTMEFRLVTRTMEGNDFFEGVRAILIDKDHNPTWSPLALGDISDKDIAAYFAPLGEGRELAL